MTESLTLCDHEHPGHGVSPGPEVKVRVEKEEGGAQSGVVELLPQGVAQGNVVEFDRPGQALRRRQGT